jgi:hypothetical protein
MRRVSALATLATLVGLVVFGRAPGIGAQAPTPAATAGHPIVGTWMVHDVEDTTAPPFRLIFLADGVVVQVDPSAGEHVGVWRPSGPRTFALIVQQVVHNGIATIRGEGEVAADGQGFTVAYTIEFAPGGGTGTGQYGPGHIAGTRLTVEPMGTPVGPLSALKAQLAKPTPGA